MSPLGTTYYLSNCLPPHPANKINLSLMVPTHMWGEELYTQMGFFFVPTILADRYIHRRELRLVSLESSSSVEYRIKKIFLIFVFYGELSRFKLLRKLELIPLFLFTFSVIFDQVFVNFAETR